MMRQLSENLYRFDDTCAVYLVKHGAAGVSIDFGAGDILDALAVAGVERITDVLMTHHHRDQGQGLARAVAGGIRIWVPHVEQDLFHSVDGHWQAREVFNSYNNRQDRFSLLEPVPVHDTLRDYATLRFEAGGLSTTAEATGAAGDVAHHDAPTFTVVPTPGHTTGSVSLLGTIDGRRVAFTGDLIHAPGKLWSLAATQWSYNGAEGVAATVASLLDVRDRAPDVLLPSHGEPMPEPGRAIDLLVERLWALLRERDENPRLLTLRESPYEALTPHLLRNRTAMAYCFVLLSASGKALLIDFGYDFVTGLAAGSDRASRRPWLYTLPALERDHGVTSIDVAIPTHYHDDHVAGLNLLREVEGTQVWAAEIFSDVLEHPERYDLPCLWYDPISVDRVLPLETPIRWEEHELTLHHQPGHAYHAVAISFEVDGTRVLAIGDQYSGGPGAQTNYVYKNGFGLGDYAASAALYRRLRPELILIGHGEPLRAEPAWYEALDRRGEVLDQAHRALLPADYAGTGAFGAYDVIASIHPYQSATPSGGTVVLDVRVRNPSRAEERVEVELAVPAGWDVAPSRHAERVAGGASSTWRFTLRPFGSSARWQRVAADVTIGERRYGQQAEALVSIEEQP